jgi:hypothetical protein
MAYDNPGNPGPMEPGEGMDDEGMHQDPGAMEHSGGIIHIPKDMLPPGMAEKINKGDILEFRCIGTADEEGDIPVEYNTGEEEKAPAWEDKFREEMSPSKQGAMPQAPPEDGMGGGEGY